MRRLMTLLSILALMGCTPAQITTGAVAPPPAPKDKMVFMAGYKAQANLPFVAAYVAHDRGFFAEENLDVEIQHSAGSGEHARLATAGVVQVTTASGQSVLTLGADPGLPLVAIAQFGQRSDQAFAVKADSPIKSAKDWEGKVVGYKSFPSLEYLAILQAAGVDRSKVKEVAVGFDPRILLTGQVDVLPVFRSNEPDILRSLGQDTRLITPDDYNIPTLGLTYVASRETIKSRRSQLVRFLRATMKATEWITKNPEEAVDIVMRYAPGEDRAHQASMLQVEIDSAYSPNVAKDGLLAIDIQQWKQVNDLMVQLGAISKSVDVTQFADDSLRREAMGKK